jgi:Zn-dependent protease
VNVHLSDLVFFGCLFFSIILHEISHGVVALGFGDDTAKRAGRLTLNPVPHIDPVGSILLPAMMVLSHAPAFGWARPVPVNPGRLRQPRRQMLWVGLVGPFTNFVIMMVAATVIRLNPGFLGSGPRVDGVPLVFLVLVNLARVNLFLGIFNLLPIPPLDGSSLIERVLPPSVLPSWYRFRQYGLLVIFLLVFLLPQRLDPLGHLISPFENRLFSYARLG